MSLNSNSDYYTVTELNNSIKKIIENTFDLIRVKGEVSQLKKHSSGHLYFSLKDITDIISVVCWRSKVSSLNYLPENGKNIIVSGRITTYSPQSKYQIIVEKIELEGEGRLLKILEDRKKKLLEEGFFNKDSKKKLPFMPSRIGIITSEDGAVIQDIIHRIKDRFPLEIVLYPVKVQGDGSLNQIINAIKTFNAEYQDQTSLLKVDLIIIARGGGDLEDLMTFNEESLVKIISYSKIPIISAIGHETDWTLCDLVSDVRAPTPSAAAEIAVPVKEEIYSKLNNLGVILYKVANRDIEENSAKLKILEYSIVDIENMIQKKFQNIDFLDIKLKKNLQRTLTDNEIRIKNLLEQFSPGILKVGLNLMISKLKNSSENLNKTWIVKLKYLKFKLSKNEKLLSSLSYKNVLMRGYGVVKSKDKIIRNQNQLFEGQDFEIELFRSKIKARKLK